MKKHKKTELFQGNLNKRNYFEGWYYKQVTRDERYSISFIPGISLSDDSHAFIQCIISDENNCLKSYYIRYSLEEFSSSDLPFKVEIENNQFSLTGISIDLEDIVSIAGEIDFGKLQTINRSVFTPNIMGFFSYIPKMECNHGLVSMNHSLKGSLVIDGKNIDFTGGKGYIEKDWGKSFPQSYVWIQSNHFDSDTSLFFSTATIPFLGFKFNGLICNLTHQGIEYRFATYNNSRLKIEKINDKEISLKIKKGNLLLKLEASIEDSRELKAPYKGNMEKVIKEVLGGNVSVTLYNKGELVFSDNSKTCGIEIVLNLHQKSET